MREALILRGDARRCAEHARRRVPKTPFFDDVNNALRFLRHERLERVTVYSPTPGPEAGLLSLGYFLRTELVP